MDHAAAVQRPSGGAGGRRHDPLLGPAAGRSENALGCVEIMNQVLAVCRISRPRTAARLATLPPSSGLRPPSPARGEGKNRAAQAECLLRNGEKTQLRHGDRTDAPSSGLRPPSPARGEGKTRAAQAECSLRNGEKRNSATVIAQTRPHPACGHLLPQGEKGRPGPLKRNAFFGTGKMGTRADHAGSSRLTQRPPPSRLASATRPPCASAISRTSASPSPVPLRLVE